MKIILGDNPFFGVDHKSGSKALELQEERFSAAAEVIATAVESGIDSMMISTHPNYEDLITAASTKLERTSSGLNLSLVIPFPHTFNDIVAHSGYSGLLRRFEFGELLKIGRDLVSRGSWIGKGEFSELFSILIRMELEKLKYNNIRVDHICLHNIFTDMFLGTGQHAILRGFTKACARFAVKPVFITQNPVAMLRAAIGTETGFAICFSMNPLGYMVNPGLAEVVEELSLLRADKSRDVELWAMQALASGSNTPDELLDASWFDLFDRLLYATRNKQRVIDFADKVKNHTLSAKPGISS